MPNRYIREGAITSRSVNALSWQAEVFWRRVLNLADDFGRYYGDPQILRSYVFPLQTSKVSEADVARLLIECEQSGVIILYAVGGSRYLFLNKWHERIRAKKSKFPGPPAEGKCAQVRADAYVYDNVYESGSDSESESEWTRALSAGIPSVEQVIECGRMQSAIPEDYCRHYHAVCTERHRWIVSNGRLIDWPREIVRWWAKDRTTWKPHGAATNREIKENLQVKLL